MSKIQTDFERSWQEKLSRSVEKATDSETRERVMTGGEKLSQDSSTYAKIRWTCTSLSRLADSTGLKERQEILAECACQYPVYDPVR